MMQGSLWKSIADRLEIANDSVMGAHELLRDAAMIAPFLLPILRHLSWDRTRYDRVMTDLSGYPTIGKGSSVQPRT